MAAVRTFTPAQVPCAINTDGPQYLRGGDGGLLSVDQDRVTEQLP
jgi:hypothetical protein